MRLSLRSLALAAAVASGVSLSLSSSSAFLPCVSSASAAVVSGSSPVVLSGGSLRVDGSPFRVRGVAYSPIPRGDSLYSPPNGDYFTLEYAYVWQRDLPLLAAAGANTLRIYGWNVTAAVSVVAGHLAFLDAAQAAGLHVMIGFELGSADSTPVKTPQQRQAVISRFAAQVGMYGRHPAIVAWSFGNELNGYWNGYLGQLSDSAGCGWTQQCLGAYTSLDDPCWHSTTCLYQQFYPFLNEAMKQAKAALPAPSVSATGGDANAVVAPLFTTTFTDIDSVIGDDPRFDKIAAFGSLLSSMDVWAMQVYRGRTFGNYLDQFQAEANGKLLLVTEFGVDAYNDPCGWQSPSEWACTGTPGDGRGGVDATSGTAFVGCAPLNGANASTAPSCASPGSTMQALYDGELAGELDDHPASAGGLVFEWSDELWKGGSSPSGCAIPCQEGNLAACSSSSGIIAFQNGGSASCAWHSHIDCPLANASVQALCGYPLGSAPDGYSNEEFFGLAGTRACEAQDGLTLVAGHSLDELQLRPAVRALARVWLAGAYSDSAVPANSASCSDLSSCYTCSSTTAVDDLLRGTCTSACGVLKYVGFAANLDMARSINSDAGNVTTPQGALGTDSPAGTKNSAQATRASLAANLAFALVAASMALLASAASM